MSNAFNLLVDMVGKNEANDEISTVLEQFNGEQIRIRIDADEFAAELDGIRGNWMFWLPDRSGKQFREEHVVHYQVIGSRVCGGGIDETLTIRIAV